MADLVEIVAVNRTQRIAVTNTDQLCQITQFLDDDGDETDDPQMAVVAIAKQHDDMWFTIDLREFDQTGVM